jgi:hypothetical protein
MPATATGLLRYPYEAITQNTDYLQIRIFEYVRASTGIDAYTKGISVSSPALDVSNYVSNKAKVLDPGGVIILPMPSNIQDSNVVSYDSDSMNAFAAMGVSAVQKIMGDVGGEIGKVASGETTYPNGNTGKNQTFEDITTKLKDLINNESVRGAATAKLATQAVNLFGANVSFNSLLARSSGKILNPNMELLFNNVTLRTFRFSFKFAPRDPNEATVVKSIIRTFKKNMAAQKSSDIFLKTPHLFKLTYRKGNQNHPFLHRFKDCALSDMSVQYTGDNVYATYSDGTPVSMIMNLTFKEMMPIYSDDYDNDDSGTAMPNQGADDGPQGNLIYGAGQNSSTDVEGVGF